MGENYEGKNGYIQKYGPNNKWPQIDLGKQIFTILLALELVVR